MRERKDHINLLPRDEKRSVGALGVGVVLAAVFVFSWAGAYGWQMSTTVQLQRREASLNAKREALVRTSETLSRELFAPDPGGTGPQSAGLISSLLQERVLWSEVFKQFSLIVPKGLWFDNLEGTSEGRAEIRIKGGAFNYLSVAEFMLAMEKSDYFEKPQLLYAQKAVVRGQDVIGFELFCAIKRREVAR